MNRQFIIDRIRWYTKKEMTSLINGLFDYLESKRCRSCKHFIITPQPKGEHDKYICTKVSSWEIHPMWGCESFENKV